jgi:iron complex transport system substrate-binding protein
MKKVIAIVLTVFLLLAGCSGQAGTGQSTTQATTSTASSDSDAGNKVVTDSYGREVTLPSKIEKIAAIGGAARFLTYAGCADKLIGVTDMDKKDNVQMPYSVVNQNHFEGLTSVGTGGSNDTTYTEELVKLAPDVIFAMSDQNTVEDVQEKTGIPVVAIYPNGIFDDSVYQALTLIGDIMGTQEHCAKVVSYIKSCQKDLEDRTKNISDESKPSVYTGAVSFRGAHGFEGTYGEYPPFEAIGAKNVVDETGQSGAYIIDKEKVVSWDPDIIFLNPGNMNLVNDDYAKNQSYYDNLTAVKNGQVYSQIAYNYNWTNVEIAIADTYYAGTVIFPDAFSDIDPAAKADEIFNVMLGQSFYQQLSDAGYTFGKITIGQ